MKNLIAFLSLGVCCLLATSAFSQTTFTVAISNDWADAGNWSNGLPAVGNDATIPAGMTVVNSTVLTTDFDITNNGNIVNYGFIYNDGTINNVGTIHQCGIWLVELPVGNPYTTVMRNFTTII